MNHSGTVPLATPILSDLTAGGCICKPVEVLKSVISSKVNATVREERYCAEGETQRESESERERENAVAETT